MVAKDDSLLGSSRRLPLQSIRWQQLVGVRSRAAQAAAAGFLTGCNGDEQSLVDIQSSKFQIPGARNALVLLENVVLKVGLIVLDTARDAAMFKGQPYLMP